MEAMSSSSPSSENTGENTLKSGRWPPPWYGSLATMTSPGRSSSPKKSMLKRTGRVELNMNWGMPTDRAESRPFASKMVALRSLLWLRMGVVAVRETKVAISKQTVSMAERMTSGVTRSTSGTVTVMAFTASGRSREFQVQAGQALEEVRGDVVELPLPGRTVLRLRDPDVGHSVEEALERDPSLGAGQGSPRTGVDTVAEGHVLARIGPVHPELGRTFELPGIVVRSTGSHERRRPSRDVDAAHRARN